MQIVKRLLAFRVSSNRLDGRIGQFTCYAVGFLIFVFGILKLTRMELTEAQLFFGVLLIVILWPLWVGLGLLLELTQAIKAIKKD